MVNMKNARNVVVIIKCNYSKCRKFCALLCTK